MEMDMQGTRPLKSTERVKANDWIEWAIEPSAWTRIKEGSPFVGMTVGGINANERNRILAFRRDLEVPAKYLDAAVFTLRPGSDDDEFLGEISVPEGLETGDKLALRMDNGKTVVLVVSSVQVDD